MHLLAQCLDGVGGMEGRHLPLQQRKGTRGDPLRAVESSVTRLVALGLVPEAGPAGRGCLRWGMAEVGSFLNCIVGEERSVSYIE